MFEVRRVVTGYTDDRSLAITSDTMIQSPGRSPAGQAIPLWSAKSLPIMLDDAGQHPRPSGLQWYLVQVPPDKDRGAAAGDYEAGILHEGSTIDLGIVVSGEVWLELDGVPEWIKLGPGETFVQRGTKHAWHNPTDTPALLSCVILSGERNEATPSRKGADDYNFAPKS